MFEDKRERELDEEIQAHLRLAEQDRIRQGESPQEAAVSARRELGNVILVKERTRDAWAGYGSTGSCRTRGSQS